MNPNSAYHIKKVIPGNNYSDATLYALHCTNTNTTTVKIKALGDTSFIEFPPESFIKGAVYSIYLLELEPGSDVEFVGYFYEHKPFSL